jgi:multiple antibiotic resistance protein
MRIEAFFQSWASVFAVVDPIAGAALFAAMTADNTHAEVKRMAARAALATGAVLTAFLFFGAGLFTLFSVTMTAFRIAGGLVIAILALDLLKATHTGVRSTAEEETEGIVKEDVSITPIAVPMLAGPGAISMVMILSARYSGVEGYVLLFTVIVLVSLSVWVLLRQAARVVSLLGRTGINVIGRLLGIVVLAIAVQFIVDGLLELAPRFREALTGA